MPPIGPARCLGARVGLTGDLVMTAEQRTLPIPARGLAAALAFASALALGFAPAAAQEREPEKKEGSATLFLRVLPKPGARLLTAPEGDVAGPVAPLMPLYVYKDGEGAQEGWTEVGRGIRSGPEGWVKDDFLVPWDQNIVAAFANRAGRERQIMFDGYDSLMHVVRHESPISMARELRRKAVEEGAAENVMTLEPEDFVDISENFYLLPILDWRQEEHPMTFELMKAMEVASLPLREQEAEAPPPEKPSAGVIFVIDTTISMEPYIEATRNAVREIVGRLRGSEAGERIRFGAIGFRDSPEAARAASPDRDVEYRTREYLSLSPDQEPDAVLAAFDGMEQARAATVGYAEDAMSGIWQALFSPAWESSGPGGEPIRLRYVVVISDASPKSPSDESLPEGIRGQDWENVRTLAAQPQTSVTLMAIHLKTADGIGNHRAAEAAYRAMTQRPDGRDLYTRVDITGGADPAAAFRPVIEQLADYVAADIQIPTEELMTAAEEGELSAEEEASLAMRLRWLGRDVDAGAPPLIRAWVLDRALENPLKPALDFRLLITKNQLSTMSDVMREVVAIGDGLGGEETRGRFFELLKGAVARISRNPDALVNDEFETLDQAIGEFLEGLPYESPILGLTSDQWDSMGTERIEWLDRARAKLRMYEYFHDDPANWTALYEGAPEGEHVFAMPIEALP